MRNTQPEQAKSPQPIYGGLVFKAIRKDGLWVITAIVRGAVEEFAGRTFAQAAALLAREIARPLDSTQEIVA